MHYNTQKAIEYLTFNDLCPQVLLNYSQHDLFEQ